VPFQIQIFDRFTSIPESQGCMAGFQRRAAEFERPAAEFQEWMPEFQPSAADFQG
jgi:hypothetical protein